MNIRFTTTIISKKISKSLSNDHEECDKTIHYTRQEGYYTWTYPEKLFNLRTLCNTQSKDDTI